MEQQLLYSPFYLILLKFTRTKQQCYSSFYNNFENYSKKIVLRSLHLEDILVEIKEHEVSWRNHDGKGNPKQWGRDTNFLDYLWTIQTVMQCDPLCAKYKQQHVQLRSTMCRAGCEPTGQCIVRWKRTPGRGIE